MAKIITQIEDFLTEAKAVAPVVYEPRLVDVTVDEAIALIQERTPEYFKFGSSDYRCPTMYRGAARSGEAYTFKPNGEVRKSAHSSNSCYNLLLKDNWYPDRLQSLICTSDGYDADRRHGENIKGRSTYVVVPSFGGRVGVCPSMDIYYSFKPFMETLGGENLGDFAELMDNMAKLVTGSYGADLDLEGWKKVFTKFDKKRKLEAPEMKPYRLEKLIKFKELVKQHGKDTGDGPNTYDYLARNISYSRDRFSRFEYGKQWPNDGKNKEMWTDAECVLIRSDLYDEAIKRLKLQR